MFDSAEADGKEPKKKCDNKGVILFEWIDYFSCWQENALKLSNIPINLGENAWTYDADEPKVITKELALGDRKSVV